MVTWAAGRDHVNGKYGPGDLVRFRRSDGSRAGARAKLVKADKVELYANGCKVREAKIT